MQASWCCIYTFSLQNTCYLNGSLYKVRWHPEKATFTKNTFPLPRFWLRMESSRRIIKGMKETTSKNSIDAVFREISCVQCDQAHKPRACPAYGQQCSICHKYNRFTRVCCSQSEEKNPYRGWQKWSHRIRTNLVHGYITGTWSDSLLGFPLLMFTIVKWHLNLKWELR